jgi:hypothetical protein
MLTPFLFQIADTATGAPRPSSDLAALRGPSLKGGKGGGWGLKPDTLTLDIIKENNIDLEKAIEHILRWARTDVKFTSS